MSKDSSLRNTYVVTHNNLFLLFKLDLHSSNFGGKLFKSTIKLFYAKILTVTLGQSKLYYPHCTPTLITEVLHLVGKVQLVKRIYCEMNSKYSITLLFLTVTHITLRY